MKRLSQGLAFDVVHEIEQRSRILVRGYEEILSHNNIGKSTVILGNVLTDWDVYCKHNGIDFDLIITSPPYCNAIEYWRRHRLEYFWLGLMDNSEIRELSREFIGSTTVLREDLGNLGELASTKATNVVNDLISRDRIRKAFIIKEYFLDSERWVNSVLSTLSPKGVAFIIVGPSKSYGVRIDTPDILSEIIGNLGYKPYNKLRYSIKNRRMQYPTRNNSAIKTETVLEIRA